MTTPIKIIISVVLFIVCSIIIALLKEAHIFGKTFVVFILLFILKIIWAKSDNIGQKINSQNNTTQRNGLAQQNNSVSNIPPQNTMSSAQINIMYNGGHNANGSIGQNNSIQPLVSSSTPSSKKGGEFEGTNPYAKN